MTSPNATDDHLHLESEAPSDQGSIKLLRSKNNNCNPDEVSGYIRDSQNLSGHLQDGLTNVSPDQHSTSIDTLLITANVGSIFEEPDALISQWIRQVDKHLRQCHPQIVAIHCQEVRISKLTLMISKSIFRLYSLCILTCCP